MPARPKASASTDSSARLGGGNVRWQWSGATGTTREGCPQGERGGVHQFGVPPKGNANFAWPRQESGFIHCSLRGHPDRRSLGEDGGKGGHLAPQGMAGFVLANGPDASGSSNQSDEGDIRRALIEADLVDCMVALPGLFFYNTRIPCGKTSAARDEKHTPKSWQSINTVGNAA